MLRKVIEDEITKIEAETEKAKLAFQKLVECLMASHGYSRGNMYRCIHCGMGADERKNTVDAFDRTLDFLCIPHDKLKIGADLFWPEVRNKILNRDNGNCSWSPGSLCDDLRNHMGRK